MQDITIGVIGGSGLYSIERLLDVEMLQIDTPFGAPSDEVATGVIDGVRVAFLARHGRSHRLLPTEIPFRANILAMKTLGVRYLISASAVGSLREDLRPLDVVIPDQFVDRTTHRPSTFFGDGIVAHVSFADPICPALASVLADAVQSLEIPDFSLHRGGIYVCMEGPAFSTRAESELYRSWGASVVGMTNVQEAKLAREAEIAYATLALVTDYDCWHPDHDTVTIEMVIENLRQNAANANAIIRNAVGRVAQDPPESEAHVALRHAIVTPLDAVPHETKARLEAILRPYL